MSHAQQMWDLLLPLGPYRRQGVYTAGELAGEGHALDGVAAALDDLEREAMLDTAEGEGLERLEELLQSRPLAQGVSDRRAALSALLRIGGDSFTLKAINDNLQGCGLNVAVNETANPGVVEVRFPDVPGVPQGFEQLKRIIQEILPCHLQVNYVYWYVTWGLMENNFPTWGNVEGHTWDQLEKMVK